MARVLFLLAVVLVLYILLRRIASLPPHKRKGEYLKLGLGVALVLTVLLALAGKMHWLGAAITGLLVAARQTLPVLVRLFPLLGALGNRNASARQSTVSTSILRMHLNHDTGALSGEVIAGPFAGWLLDEMSREQLDALQVYCQEEDEESRQLLDGYLEQRFADESRASTNQAPPPGGAMNRSEALEILGLGDDADREAIIEAHRKLIQKLHPDRGGSDYLAAKINQAKDLLLQD